MSDDKWGELVDKISSQFGILDQGHEKLDDVPNGSVEFIIFESPLGKMMLERTTKPRVTSERSLGGSKYGAGSRIEKTYSDTEMTHVMAAYKENNGEWEPFDAGGFI